MRYFALVCSGLILAAASVFAEDENAYAAVYSSPEASSDLPPNLVIAKGLPEGNESIKKQAWESNRTPAPAKKLIPVRSRESKAPASAPVAAPRE